MDSPDLCTASRLRKAARLASQVYDAALSPWGLTTGQFGMLGAIAQMKGARLAEMAERLAMDPSTLSRGINPLIRQGLVAYEPDPTDRRAKRLRATAKGKALHKAARTGWRQAQDEVKLALGPDTVTRLNQALDEAIERL
ncbi:MarR family winged helix-turn-helix transcriptional regulator [Phenylobacterium sp.]|uniref:MarR family winged helix-turn-helix transcriptional regulator n=1 Tax=Phenylobacterium sp. TaxID=1871053 RepID=UPI0030F3889B